MNFDTAWDIEKYYCRHEPTEHWDLRQRFMEVNKTKFPEQRLVSLAATFLNIETLGCSYNPKVMQLIEELSKGVVEEYRERKKLKLQKVFVKASDAAASKVKGQAKTVVTREENVPDAPVLSENEPVLSGSAPVSSDNAPILTGSATVSSGSATVSSGSVTVSSGSATASSDSAHVSSGSAHVSSGSAHVSSGNAPVSRDISIIDISNQEPTAESASMADESIIEISDDDSSEPEEELRIQEGNKKAKKKKPHNNAGQGKEKKKKKWYAHKYLTSADLLPIEMPRQCWTSYGNMVLIEDDAGNVLPKQIIERSASLCRANLAVLEEQPQGSNETTVKICIHCMEVASATDMNKKKAREIAFQLALQKLQEQCFTIKIKCRRYDQCVGRNFALTEVHVAPQKEQQKEQPPSVPASGSIALKMMANMGWTGGGLGKTQQGITEPISLSVKANRSGLGVKPKEENQVYYFENTGGSFQQRALIFLEAYARSNMEQDLVFKSEFTSDERKVLHNLAARFDLKSKSYGKQKKRHLVISRKLEPFRVLRTLLTPGYTSQKYELKGPKCFQN